MVPQVLLAVASFALGFGLTAVDGATLALRRGAILVALVLQLGLAPLIAAGLAYAVSAAQPGAAMAPVLGGLILALASGIAGRGAPLIASLCGGALDLTRGLTLAGIVAVSVMLGLLAVALPVRGALMPLLAAFLVPAALGFLLRARAPGLARREGMIVTAGSFASLALAALALLRGGLAVFPPALALSLVVAIVLTILGRLAGRVLRLNVSGQTGLALALSQRSLALPLAASLQLSQPMVGTVVAAYGLAMWTVGLGFMVLRLRALRAGGA